MFEQFQQFLRTVAGDGKSDSRETLTRDNPRVAMAALAFHVVEADGEVSDAEREALSAVLKDEFDLNQSDLRSLLQAGQKADDEAVDLYSFTRVLKRALDAEQKVSFVELLWELVYADGVRHELEDHVVWRIAELLGVSGRDRVLMRKQVKDRTVADTDADQNED